MYVHYTYNEEFISFYVVNETIRKIFTGDLILSVKLFDGESSKFRQFHIDVWISLRQFYTYVYIFVDTKY